MSARRVETLRLIWLEAFIALADEGSFTAAAEKLGCKQSTVSRYLSDLERWLKKVVVANSVPLTFSADGEAFLPIARQVVQQLNNSRAGLP